ncbi:hypothetical protein [Erwinia tasmaniensis]|nr:hypothetical protein [Erwinia tasmaniensis]
MAEALGLWWGDNKPISEMGMAGCHQIVVGTLSPYDRMLQTQQT